MSAAVAEIVSVSELVAAIRRQQAPRQLPASDRGPSSIRGVSVVGAHRGAGATSVAVALVDVLDAIQHPAALVDLAPSPDAFAAAECEVDSRVPGWRAGRRGKTQVLRRRTDEVADPDFSTDLVVDGRMETLGSQVLVCRATLPSVHRVEAHLPDGTVVAVVGSSRWPRVVASSLGPALRRATDDGRVVFVRYDRHLELYGIGAEQLPFSVRAAAHRVIRLLWPELAGSSSPHGRKGIRR
jgi:hypothetical protein